MDDDGDNYPHSGNAYPATAQPTESASSHSNDWRPTTEALPPDDPHVPESEADFFDRYPGATPKKGQRQDDEGAVDAADAEESVERRQSISVEHIVDVRKEAASPEELARVPESHAEVTGPVTNHVLNDEDDDEAAPLDGTHDDEEPIFKPDETVREQEKDLEGYMPDVPTGRYHEATQLLSEGVEQVDHAAAASTVDEEAARPEEHYEHQGEISEMERAQEPAEASLMQDEEAPPTSGLASREPTMELDSIPSPRHPPSQSHAAPPHIDRSFSTNFVQQLPVQEYSQQPQREQHARSVHDKWPAAGDDKTFGELLDDSQPANTQDESALEQQAAREAEQITAPDEDLAAAWQAALDEDELLDESKDTRLDPSKFFDEEGDGFLDDEPALAPPPAPQQLQGQQQQRSIPTQYRPENAPQRQSHTAQSPYAAPGPQFVSQSHGRAAGTPDTGLYDIYNHGASAQQPQPQQQQAVRPGVQQAQSFADKSKGGYQSPYDLPIDVVKPRRHPQRQPQAQIQTNQAPAPPPRTSSFGQPQTVPPPTQTPRQNSVSSLSPPPSSSGPPSTNLSPATPNALGSAKMAPKTDGGFFADLPMASKPRRAPATGAFASQAAAAPSPGPIAPPQPHPSRASAPSVQPPQRPAAPPTQVHRSASMYGELRPPDRLPLLPDQPITTPAQTAHTPPAPIMRFSPNNQVAAIPAQSRYSPAPTANAPMLSRYSPAPATEPSHARTRYPPPAPNTPPSIQGAVHPFAPRTSSPLAHQFEKPHPPLPAQAPRYVATSPPALNGASLIAASAGMSPNSRGSSNSRHSPADPPVLTPASSVGAPPQRPRTQSPSETMKQPRMAMTPRDRTMSAAGAPAPMAQPLQRPKGLLLPHRRQFSRELTFAVPPDARAQDPLERWKGHPIFTWNAAGGIVTSFPRQTRFYAAGQGIPSVKCTPGDITLLDATTVLPISERDAKFPGPLTARSKGRKKDVLAWMSDKIEDLQRETEGAMLDFSVPSEWKKRTEEKLVLWKIMRTFVEHDGVLEGKQKIDEEVRRVLLPNLAQMGQVMELQQSPTSAFVTAEPVDNQVLLQLRQALLEGQRERAVWLAEEKRLWGHAMLIASTLGGDTWKQIIQSFVRLQVKSIGSDARSLAALYQIFAGNSEESVDELVPPSARAGFQMISKADGTAAGNPLEGLNQWRETLGLVTSNRTLHDGPSLVALGKLLSGYGRVEAAHTCYLFARSFVKHSGADEGESAHFTLLGADHRNADENLGNDLDSIMLTEIYEWACSLSLPSTAVPYVPHLQAFKLVHAEELAARGLKSKAQSYCEHITSAYTSTTRPSQYYHPTFTQAVNALAAFLSQAPQDGKSGFFSKPAMNKVSSGVGTWFQKFVTGDEDRGSTVSGPGAKAEDVTMAGPFGSVNGDGASLSRSASGPDLYTPMMGGSSIPGPSVPVATAAFAPSSTPSRYTPLGLGSQKTLPQQAGANPYASQAAAPDNFSPTEVAQSLAIPSLGSSRPGSARAASSRYAPAQTGPNLGVPRPGSSRAASDYGMPYATGSRRGSAQDPGSQGSYEPSPSLAQEPSPYTYPSQAQQQTSLRDDGPEDAFAGPNGLLEQASHDTAGPDAEGGSGYAYEPPSSQPYQPEPEPEEDAEDAASQPKRQSFMDNDENDAELEKRAVALKKAQADREADEAFRKAAEADATRDKERTAAEKKGWFGGWFKGKDPNLAPGPIRAKLGEENSFYYDENLKKWVNKKAGPDTATPAAPTPPPPRGPASRAPSAAVGPPSSGPPSRVSSGVGLASLGSRPATSGSGPPLAAGPLSGPPSRPATPASNPDSPGVPVPGLNGDGSAPPSRPPTSMSMGGSLDELLAGPPGARKGGTVKGKKKGGRYVDVMAK